MKSRKHTKNKNNVETCPENSDIKQNVYVKKQYVLPWPVAKSILTIIGLILLFISMVCFWALFKQISAQVKAKYIWPTAYAEVISSKLGVSISGNLPRRRFGQPHAEFISIKYSVNNGQVIYSDIKGAVSRQYFVGQKIKINYNPWNPNDFVLKNEPAWRLMFVYLLVGCCSAFVSWIFLTAKQEKNEINSSI